MREASPGTGRAIALFCAGVALAASGGLGGAWAAVGGTLAQAVLALAVVRSRGAAADGWPRRGLTLTLLWALGVAGLAALVAWPLAALLHGGSLLSALGLSAAVGAALLGLWRLWPLWHGIERDGGTLPEQWQLLRDVDAGAWRGLGVAAIVLALAGGIIALAWPELIGGSLRWTLAAGLAIASAIGHGLLQRIAPPTRLPGLEFDDLDVDDLDDIDGAPGEAADATTDAATAAFAEGVMTLPEREPLEAPLYTAARTGRVERALELIEAGADVHAPPPPDERDQRSLVVLAAVLPDLRLLRGLIARGIDLNARHAGMTPLLAATRDSWHGRPDAVMTLLANGADPRAVDHDGNTALHFAARSSDPGVAALLRDAAAEIDPLNADGLTPLGVACAAGNWRLAKFLLERGAKPDLPDGQPALLAAAGGEDDDPAGVLLLLKLKAKVDARDDDGRSALHQAAFAGHPAIVEALLAAGADAAAVDTQGRTPVLEAARGGGLAVLERLLAHLPRAGAGDVAAVDAHGRNALALACVADNATPALLQRLLAAGVDPAGADDDGKRAVDRAAEAGRWSLVALLDPDYALPSSVNDADGSDALLPDRTPASLLRDGLDEGRDDLAGLARLLSPAELDVQLHASVAADVSGDEPGVYTNATAADKIAWLLAQGADPDVRNGCGDTVLFALLDRGAAGVPMLRALLAGGASPSGKGGLARFLGACALGDAAAPGLEACALDLLERGADAFASSRLGDPPLALAVRLNWARLMDRLLAAGVALDARDSHGMGALHLAAALSRESMLKQLLAHGASPELVAADGQTPLGVALSSGRRDLADWLDWRGWPLPLRRLLADDVPAAAIVGDADAVRRLLDLGLPVDAIDNQGCTALLRAAGGGHRAVVDLLLARGADPQLAAHSGATPLSAAVSMRHADIVDRLIVAGAALEQRLPGELTVLMVACALGLPDVAARLLAAGADIHAVDGQGRTALHCAAMFGFTARERSRLAALLDTLLLGGAEADLPAAGATPLLLLLGARADPGTAADEDVLIACMQQLLDYDASLDAKESRGFGPLHLAALHGLLHVVQTLLRAGADPDLRDAINRTPREIAVMRGFIDIAAEFAPSHNGGNVSMARFLREPR